ncbi:MAG: arginine deiminase family protein [Thermoanaerobaculia bacterium]
MSKSFGGQNMFHPLRRVLVKRPDEIFAVEAPERWHYVASPDLETAQQEHDSMVETLQQSGAEVLYHEELQPDRADAIYVFDPILLTDHGAVVLSMGKDLRRGEEEALARRLGELGIPTLFSLEGEARAEGGDLLWLDETTLAAGIGFRTNQEGVRQLRAGLEPLGIEVLAFELPYLTGPEACLHLLSLISIIDHDLAVVYPRLMPVPFWLDLQARGFQLVIVPEKEFGTMGTNVLALGPRDCLVLEGNPGTRHGLEEAGCRVSSYRGNEISLKCEGGPTCLTRPLLRQA